jgi:RNA polymerase sigma-70 factor (ECF subfamily)
MSRDDTQLMQRVQGGDVSAFDELVTRYRPALTRVAAGMLGDSVAADDAVQETFLAVFAARRTFNPSLSFRTWLWTILLNLCRRHRARLVRRPQGLANPAELAASQGTRRRQTSGPETAIESLLTEERNARLQRFLDELPDAQADAIRLRFFAELTYDEIARSTGVSIGGAKLRVRSGLAALSRLLRRDGESCHEL